MGNLIKNPKINSKEHIKETDGSTKSLNKCKIDKSPKRGKTEIKLYPTRAKKATERSGWTPQRKITKEMGKMINSNLTYSQITL